MTPIAHRPLAIVGMACRLPGADDLDEYWQLLTTGGSVLGELPPERFDRERTFHPEKGVRHKSYTSLGGLITDRGFDREKCPLSDELINRSHRTHLTLAEVAADACRHAGMDAFNLPDRKVGVYIGHTPPSALAGEVIYARLVELTARWLHEIDSFNQLAAGRQQEIIDDVVHRVRSGFTADNPAITMCANAYHAAALITEGFNLDGPSMSFDAACASSLRAMGHGARALQAGHIEMAVVGGASYCHQDTLVLFSQAQSVSPSGSRPFDNDADGLVAAEGYVVVLMKTLEKAIADGDNVCAVVRGIGISSDGKGKSLWAPRKEGQIEAIHRAYGPGMSLDELQYLEMHATSTQVGDATEMAALTDAFAGRLPAGMKIPVGSVKANVGHTLETAGIASLVKTVLAMQHGVIPPQINISKLNETIDWPNLPFFVPQEPLAWDSPACDRPRRAAVNAFGIGGLNVHVVLDEHVEAASRALVSKFSSSNNSHAIDDQSPGGDSTAPAAIAVVGMGAIVPGARTIDALWDVLISGRDQKRRAPADRWDADLLCEPGSDRLWRVPTAVGGFIEGFEYDWKRHKVPPKQVASADPLQFMLLDATEQALHHAGYDEREFDRTRTGVIVGTIFGGEFTSQLQMGLRLPEFKATLTDVLRDRGVADELILQVSDDFEDLLLKRMPALIDETGSFTASTLASRITKTFNLMGGATALDSGAASSMAALDCCIDLLAAGDCDMMICASGQRALGYPTFEAMMRVGLLASGEAHGPFDAQADGALPGEGVGVVVLKRLADAERDGDTVHAVIRGVGVGRDESLERGVRFAIERCRQATGITAEKVSLIEASSSGVPKADRQELSAIRETTSGRSRTAKLLVGAAAGQFGYLAGGSGIVALLKAILELNHVEAPAIVGVETPLADGDQNHIDVLTHRASLPALNEDGRLFAGVNSYGQHKVAYHMLVEGRTRVAPETNAGENDVVRSPKPTHCNGWASHANWRIVRIAASEQGALRTRLEQAANNASTAYDNAAEHSFNADDRFRCAIVADSPDAFEKLARLAAAQFDRPEALPLLNEKGIFFHEVSTARRPRVAFLFPGQGSQYTGMFKSLVEEYEPAADALRDVDAVLQELGLPSFADVAWSEENQLGTDVWRTQLSLLAADMIAYSAVRSAGLTADRAAGHSFGELVALAAADAWTFKDAVRATSARCAAIDGCRNARGVMLSTDGPSEAIEALCRSVVGRVYISHRNSPSQTVVGGDEAAVAQLAELVKEHGFRAKILDVPAAFHTPLMEEVKVPFGRALAEIPLEPPRIPLLSSVSNRYVAEPADVRENLVLQMTQPVAWTDLVLRMADEGVGLFIEVGPKQVLTGLGRQILAGRSALFVGCDHPKRGGMQQLLFARACAEVSGALDPQPAGSIIRGVDAPNAAPRRDIQSQSHAEHPAEEGLNVLRLSGTAYEMGFQHGRAQKQQIRRVLRRYADLVGTRWDRVVDLDEAARRPEEFFGPEELEELRGVAKGADVTMSAVVAHNLRLYLNAGSGGIHFALTAGANESNGLVHAVNEDLQYGLSVRDCLTRNIQVRRPADALPHVAFGVAGQVGSLNGVNAAGVAVSTSALLDVPKSAAAAAGRLLTVVVKNILEEAETVEQAVEIVRRSPGCFPWALCVSHHASDRLCYIEYDGEEINVESSTPAVVAANHRLMTEVASDQPPHSARRLTRLKDLLGGEQPTDVSAERAKQVLRDRFDLSRGREASQPNLNTVYRVDNQISIVMRPGAGDLWVTGGPLSNGHQHEFTRLELDQLLPGLRPPSGSSNSKAPADERNATPPEDDAPTVEISAEELNRSYADATAGDDDSVCKRYVMRLVESPPSVASSKRVTLDAPAVVLGANPASLALQQRLEADGNSVHLLPASDSAEQTVAALEHLWREHQPRHLFLATPHDGDAVTALDDATWQRRRRQGVMLPYLVCQRWYQLAVEADAIGRASCTAITAMGGDFGISSSLMNAESGALAGLVKGVAMELELQNRIETFKAKVVDFPLQAAPEEIADAVCRELAAGDDELEVGWIRGKRFLPRPVVASVDKLNRTDLPAGAPFVVTGGARGVTAVVARELGRRYGVKLHLLGSSPLPDIPDAYRNLSDDDLKDLRAAVMKEAHANGEKPIDAWTRYEKALEIDAVLRSFHDAGVEATYHAADVADRAALAAVLERIRRADGPICGIVHGAGYEKASRFEKKQVELVDRTIAAKVDGAAALMALTRDDPLRYFAAFGSVSGRFGGVGQTDYCAANEMLAKLVDWHRRERPDCRSTVFHWHAWDDVGMAVRPESKHIAKLHNIRFMPSMEGVNHLIEELRANLPEGEIVVTELDYCLDKYGSTSGLVADEADESTTARLVEHSPMIDGVENLNGRDSLTASVVLDPTSDVFLTQHRFKGRPMMPVVMTLEAIAEAAAILAGDDRRVVALREIEILNGLRFHSDDPQHARVHAAKDGGRIRCDFTCDFHNRGGRLLVADRPCLRAVVDTADRLSPLPIELPEPPAEWNEVWYPDEDIVIYHGPPLRCLHKINFKGDEAWARLTAPPIEELGGDRRGDRWRLPAAVLDACFFACGICLWVKCDGVVAIPGGIGGVHFGRIPEAGEECIVHIVDRGRTGNTAAYDFAVFGADGAPLLAVDGYQNVIVAEETAHAV